MSFSQTLKTEMYMVGECKVFLCATMYFHDCDFFPNATCWLFDHTQPNTIPDTVVANVTLLAHNTETSVSIEG